ncbi:MAG: autotransporter outer membrane beta-barrel domain-containing protein, partial [Desulfuromonadaceae bacterium]|nr:autotransporter outer membrane beta-barrel domain-containing protein [Desulfuromonadaceae bacterium]
EFSLEWAHEYGNTDRDVKARFAGTTGTFTVDGIEPERDSLLVGVGVNLYANEKLTVGVDYNGEFRSDFDAHQLSANLRFNF